MLGSVPLGSVGGGVWRFWGGGDKYKGRGRGKGRGNERIDRGMYATKNRKEIESHLLYGYIILPVS